jgi:tRNA(fMet)-specific endonuclease VapC
VEVLVLDTNIISYLMKGHLVAEHYRRHLEGKTLAISFMTVGELFEGAFRSRWGAGRMNELRAQIRNYLVIPYSPRVCEIWGRIRAERRSQPIAVGDAWIAATALAHDCPLVTHNPVDFLGIPDLQIVTEHSG